MLLGYARVSKSDDSQDTAAQVSALKSAGCKRVFEDKPRAGAGTGKAPAGAEGGDPGRPRLRPEERGGSRAAVSGAPDYHQPPGRPDAGRCSGRGLGVMSDRADRWHWVGNSGCRRALQDGRYREPRGVLPESLDPRGPAWPTDGAHHGGTWARVHHLPGQSASYSLSFRAEQQRIDPNKLERL